MENNKESSVHFTEEDQLGFVKNNIEEIANQSVRFQQFIPMLCEMLNEYSSNVTKYGIVEGDVTLCSQFVKEMLLPMIDAAGSIAEEAIEKEDLKND